MLTEYAQFVDETRPWLGGFIPGGDPATYYPELFEWLVKEFGARSVVDVGCGCGVVVKKFEELLYPGVVLGIDGIAQDHPSIKEHDYTAGPLTLQHEYDLAWCCETLEHIEEKFLPNILSTLVCAKTLLITHAFPGQAGHWHVNCQTPSYWIGVFAGVGYRLDEELTKTTRGLSCLNLSPWNHFKRSGMVFTKN